MPSLDETIAWLADSPGGPIGDTGTLADLARFALHLAELQPPASGPISCGRGCSACCHQPAPLTPAEAFHVAALISRSPAMRKRLADGRRRERSLGITADHPDRMSRWQTERIPCPALGPQGECTIHPQRPLVCREHLVASDPRFCADPSGYGIRLIPPAWPLREALEQACAILLDTTPLIIRFDAVASWTHRHRAWGVRRWPRAVLIDALLRSMERSCATGSGSYQSAFQRTKTIIREPPRRQERQGRQDKKLVSP
jgi:Fe-S-cluster containining protein